MKKSTAFFILYFIALLVGALLSSCGTSRGYHTSPVKFKSNSCGYYFNHKKHGK